MKFSIALLALLPLHAHADGQQPPQDSVTFDASGQRIVLQTREWSDFGGGHMSVQQKLRVGEDGNLHYTFEDQSSATQAYHRALCDVDGLEPAIEVRPSSWARPPVGIAIALSSMVRTKNYPTGNAPQTCRLAQWILLLQTPPLVAPWPGQTSSPPATFASRALKLGQCREACRSTVDAAPTSRSISQIHSLGVISRR